jgi:hypothetical protein
MRWHYRDALLVWLFPAAYGCHILEEWVAGFPEWIRHVAGAPLPRITFVAVNGTAMALLCVAARASIRLERHGWMAVASATVVLVDAVLHIAGSLATGIYSPGLLTAVILYVPLGQLLLFRAWYQSNWAMMRRGVLAGLAAHAATDVFTIAAARLE